MNRLFNVIIPFLVTALLSACGGGSSSSPASTPQPASYSISGSLTGVGASPVSLHLHGVATKDITVTGDGSFEISGLQEGQYFIDASAAGYAFSPASRAIQVAGGNISSVNFSATPITQAVHSLAGVVNGPAHSGLIVSISGAGSGTTYTGVDGGFSFSGLTRGTYTVSIVAPPCMALQPASATVSLSDVDLSGIAFSENSSACNYAVSGAITGAVQAGVPILAFGVSGSATTQQGGFYTLSGLGGGSYTISPSMAGYAFNPVSTVVNVNGGNLTGIDFVAFTAPSTYTLSGAVSGNAIGGVKVTLAGPVVGTSLTDSAGKYIFSGLPPGTYSVLASLQGHTFTGPISVTVGPNAVNQNFIEDPFVTGSGSSCTQQQVQSLNGKFSGSATVSGSTWDKVYNSAHPNGVYVSRAITSPLQLTDAVAGNSSGSSSISLGFRDSNYDTHLSVAGLGFLGLTPQSGSLDDIESMRTGTTLLASYVDKDNIGGSLYTLPPSNGGPVGTMATTSATLLCGDPGRFAIYAISGTFSGTKSFRNFSDYIVAPGAQVVSFSGSFTVNVTVLSNVIF